MSFLSPSSSLRNLVGSAVSNHIPTAIQYLAPKKLREKYHLSSNDWFIDICEKRSERVIRVARNNAVYVLDMMRSFDYYFESTNSVEARRIGGDRIDLVDFSTPRFHQISGFTDFPVMCSSLAEPFVTTQQYLDFAALQTGDVVIDLGSYSCLTSIAFSKAVGGEGRVVALEPDPLNFQCCKVNLLQYQQNTGSANIDLLNVAVSNTESFLEFSSEGSMGSSASNLVGTFRGRVTKIPCRTLGEIAKSSALKRVDFVKMDIEGSEQSVVESSQEFFERFRPRVIIEPHFVAGVLTDAPVMAALTKYGYTCSVIPQTGVDLPLIIGTSVK